MLNRAERRGELCDVRGLIVSERVRLPVNGHILPISIIQGDLHEGDSIDRESWCEPDCFIVAEIFSFDFSRMSELFLRVGINKADPHLVLFHIEFSFIILSRSEPDTMNGYLSAANVGARDWLKSGDQRNMIVFESVFRVSQVDSQIFDKLFSIECNTNDNRISGLHCRADR